MDRIRSHVGHDCGRSGGIPLRHRLFGYFAQEPVATEVDGFHCSRKSLKYAALRQKAPGEPARGFSLAEVRRGRIESSKF
jgi:hypothetical protein